MDMWWLVLSKKVGNGWKMSQIGDLNLKWMNSVQYFFLPSVLSDLAQNFCAKIFSLKVFLLVSCRKPDQWRDDIAKGQLNHFIVITLLQQLPSGNMSTHMSRNSYIWIDLVQKLIYSFQIFLKWIDYMIYLMATVLLIYLMAIIWAITMVFWCFWIWLFSLPKVREDHIKKEGVTSTKFN